MAGRSWRSIATCRRGWTGVALLILLVSVAGATLGVAQDVVAEPPGELLRWQTVDPDASAEELVVEDRAVGRTRRLVGRRLLSGSDEMYLDSAAMADLLQANRLWQAANRHLTLRVGGHDYRFTDGSRLVGMGAHDVLLPVPVLHVAGDLWLPMVFLTAVLAPESGIPVVWRSDDLRLVLGRVDLNVTGLRLRRLTRATSLHVRCTEPLSYRASSPKAGIIELKVYDGKGDLGRLRDSRGQGLVESVRARQYESHLLLTVGVDDLVTRYRTTASTDGLEIILTVEEEQVSALPDPVPRGRAEMAIDQGPVDVTRRLEVRTVVIDPGHGGGDPGVAGRNGTVEKDINLAVARALADDLRRRGLAVVLTRDGDSHVGLAERAEIANAAGGDLFISLHCNGWFDAGARGIETYFLSPAKSDWSKSVETLENKDHDDPGDVEFIVWDLVQNRYISASSDLAEVVQRHVTRALHIPDRGVRQAGFRVLVGAWMPAVLIELGFLTHPDDAAQLSRDSYRRQLAHAIGDAIETYRNRVARQAESARGSAE